MGPVISVTDLVTAWCWAFLYESNTCLLRDPVSLGVVKYDCFS